MHVLVKLERRAAALAAEHARLRIAIDLIRDAMAPAQARKIAKILNGAAAAHVAGVDHVQHARPHPNLGRTRSPEAIAKFKRTMAAKLAASAPRASWSPERRAKFDATIKAKNPDAPTDALERKRKRDRDRSAAKRAAAKAAAAARAAKRKGTK